MSDIPWQGVTKAWIGDRLIFERPAMTPLQMIAEWERGCSCATEGKPEECTECTKALIEAIKRHEQAYAALGLR